MLITEITKQVNKSLADEMYSFDDLKYHMDKVIDDINDSLNSNYPSLSGWNDYVNAYNKLHPSAQLDIKNYSVIPDKYIRSVLIIGTCYKFYTSDEEGEKVANQFYLDYNGNLFRMIRDFLSQVPIEFQAPDTGYIQTEPESTDGVIGVII